MIASVMSSKNVPMALVTGVTSFAWYALPDVVADRGLRGLIKVGMVGILVGSWVTLDGSALRADDLNVDKVVAAMRERPGSTAAVAGVTIAASTALAVAGEKAIFAFGERRRARGVRGAHAAPALALGVMAAVGALLEPRASAQCRDVDRCVRDARPSEGRPPGN